VLEYRVSAIVKASVPLYTGVTAISSVGFVNAWNHGNIKGNSFTDIQLSIAFSIDALKLGFSFM